MIGVLFTVATVVSAFLGAQGRLRWTEYEVRTRVGGHNLG